MSKQPNEPNEPRISAVARADGTGTVFVDGERSEIRADDVAGVRAAIIARVIDEATARGRRVRVAITDLDGVYPLTVHPDGTVESAGPMVEDAGVGTDARDTDAADNDGVDKYETQSTAKPGRDEPVREAGPTRAAAVAETFGQPATALIPPPPLGIEDLIDFAEVEPDPTPLVGRSFEPAPTRRSTFRSHVDEADSRANNSGSVLTDTKPAAATDTATRSGGTLAPNFGADFAAGFAADVTTMPAPEPDADLSSLPEASVVSAPNETQNVQPEGSAPAAPTVKRAPQPAGDGAPTLDDFLQSRPAAPEGPAKKGWQGVIRRLTGGLISPRPGKAERSHRDAIQRVQRSLKGPRTIVVLNPKGGAHKTTATLLLAATFGTHRGGSTLAWDNNETRGTLGWRAQPSRHSNTAVDLLRDLGRFADVESARVGYLDNYVRGQGDAQFDVLASDEDAAASSTIDADAFDSLHSTLSRFYRVLVIDTGNNMRASNWEAAVEAADQLVVVTTVNEETAASAAWLIDGLRQKGHQDKVSQAVTILSAPGDAVQPELSQRLHSHFAALTRVVLEVPYDPGFQGGGPLNVDVLSPQTREAWLQVTAAVADGL